MAQQVQQELAPLNVPQQTQAAHVVVRKQAQPLAPKRNKQYVVVKRQAPPEVLFQRKLRENDGCCSSWCSAHFFVIYLLLSNITNVVIAGYHLKVLLDDYWTHELCYYPSAGAPKECVDAREFYENAGLTIPFLSIEIAFLSIYTCVCIFTFHALQECVPWIFMTLYVCINIQVIFILVHSILCGLYWGVFGLFIPIMLSCYFWMLYQLAQYFQQGGIYDENMSTLSPAPNNYAVMHVADPADLAHYHANYRKKRTEQKILKLFRDKMNAPYDFCCCMCTQQTWSVIWLIYMILQNLLWFASAVTTTVILYDDYETWMNCVVPDGESTKTVDCRELFEDNGLTKTFCIFNCFMAGIAVMVNVWCWFGLYSCNKSAFMAQVWCLFIQSLFMLLFSIFTGYYFGLFALLVPLLLSCHFYDVYIVAVYCKQEINTKRIPKMRAVVMADTPQPKPHRHTEEKGDRPQPVPQQAPRVIYVAAPYQQPIHYVNQQGQTVQQPIIQTVPIQQAGTTQAN